MVLILVAACVAGAAVFGEGGVGETITVMWRQPGEMGGRKEVAVLGFMAVRMD